jgi:hypothetical protein
LGCILQTEHSQSSLTWVSYKFVLQFQLRLYCSHLTCTYNKARLLTVDITHGFIMKFVYIIPKLSRDASIFTIFLFTHVNYFIAFGTIGPTSLGVRLRILRKPVVTSNWNTHRNLSVEISDNCRATRVTILGIIEFSFFASLRLVFDH